MAFSLDEGLFDFGQTLVQAVVCVVCVVCLVQMIEDRAVSTQGSRLWCT